MSRWWNLSGPLVLSVVAGWESGRYLDAIVDQGIEVRAMEKGYCAIEVDVLVMRRVRLAEETLLVSLQCVSRFQFLWLLRLVCLVTLIWIVAAFDSRPGSLGCAELLIRHQQIYAP